jgi:hypothetical protein
VPLVQAIESKFTSSETSPLMEGLAGLAKKDPLPLQEGDHMRWVSIFWRQGYLFAYP